jgi:hypothetical protein
MKTKSSEISPIATIKSRCSTLSTHSGTFNNQENRVLFESQKTLTDSQEFSEQYEDNLCGVELGKNLKKVIIYIIDMYVCLYVLYIR